MSCHKWYLGRHPYTCVVAGVDFFSGRIWRWEIAGASSKFVVLVKIDKLSYRKDNISIIGCNIQHLLAYGCNGFNFEGVLFHAKRYNSGSIRKINPCSFINHTKNPKLFHFISTNKSHFASQRCIQKVDLNSSLDFIASMKLT